MLRFAPSPTHDMHTGELRVAIFNYMIDKQKDVNFIVRIEDTDKEHFIEGKDTEILQILEKFALPHHSVNHQSENLHIHQTFAIRLLEEQKAFVCTCTEEQLNADKEEAKKNGVTYHYSGHCSNVGAEELIKIKENQTPFVIRVKKPEHDIVTHDFIQGDTVTSPDDVDSFIILRNDSTPTYNFACACDDMISGVSLVLRGEDHLYDTPKQEYIKQLLGYEEETKYAHLPNILNDEDKKLKLEDDAGTVKWLFEQGFIPDAIANYLILLGNEVLREIFTMPEALEWFRLEKISKSPTKFDIEKMRFINREHLKMMDNRQLSTLFGFADADIGKLAKIYLEEASTIKELEAKIRPVFSPKDFECEWGEQMRILEKLIWELPMIDTFEEFKSTLMKESGLEGTKFLKPLRVLLTGSQSGPELSDIYPLIKPYLLEVAS